MKNINILFLGIFFTNFLYAQDKTKTDKIEVSIVDSTTIKIDRLKTNQILSIPFKLFITNVDSLENYILEIKVNNEKSNLYPNNYDLIFDKIPLSKAKDLKEIILKLKKDSIVDRIRVLQLDIKISKNDTEIELQNNDKKSLKILINPIKDELSGYEYLAYVGTNFDLVEGVRAKDLFFAANIFNTPKVEKKNVGFYLSIYGNRAFTQIDSSAIIRTTVRVKPLTDTTYSRVNTTNYFLTKEVTDNLGTYISPLINLKIFNPNREKRDLNLYYAPSLEFVYRRTNITYEDTGRVVRDSTLVTGNINDAILPPNNSSPLFGQIKNEFTFNFGIVGLFMSLENKSMSIRVHGSVGYSSNYFRKLDGTVKAENITQEGDIFFAGKAWITESTTGITLQAEVTNSFDKPTPFFVATLSKAFNFKDLGKIFQPIANK